MGIKEYVMAGVVVVLIGLIGYYKVKVSNLENEVTDLQTQLQQTKDALKAAIDANQSLQRAIDEQNKKVEEWAAKAEQAKKEAEAAIAKAKEDAAKWKTKYDKILRAPPSNPQDECASLKDRIDQYLNLRRDQWKTQ